MGSRRRTISWNANAIAYKLCGLGRSYFSVEWVHDSSYFLGLLGQFNKGTHVLYVAECDTLESTTEMLAVIVIIIQSSDLHSEKLFTK